MRRVCILGSTGSIGAQALDVVAALPDEFGVRSLAAHRDVDALTKQIGAFRPDVVCVVDTDAAGELRRRFPHLHVLDGPDALAGLAGDAGADVVLNAVVGAAGLDATLAALDSGKHLALANKESCVAAGPLVARRLASGRGSIVPVDSEHAATHMCMRGEESGGVARLVLTASGGPFRGRTRADLEAVGVRDALAHPTWRMGAKITVDSATLMNKGLEVIEAHVLFGLPYERIDVVCHPQSVVHCLVGFTDGSWKSSLSPPDMRVTIAYALGYPKRPRWGAPEVRWHEVGALTFEPVDVETFASLPLAYRAGRSGGVAPAVLNAANEIAVAAFLDGALRFLQIPEVVERVLDRWDEFGDDESLTLDEVHDADARARRDAASVAAALSR